MDHGAEVSGALGGSEDFRWSSDFDSWESGNRPPVAESSDRAADITLKTNQGVVYNDDSRFRVLVAGRRFGKSYLAVPELLRMADGYWRDGSDREAWYVAPTYKQARRDLWRPLKRLARPFIANSNETTMTVELIGGGRISLHGADNYDSLRGAGLNGLILDEYADIAPEAWTEALRPMLSDRLGRALFIGTPEGFNHFYDLHSEAQTREGWRAWQFTTLQGGNVPPEEIEAAKADLDEKVFRQEYEASFESLYVGRAYYAFTRALNLRALEFDPSQPICWAMDFNVNPMASVLVQIVGGTLNILQEIVIPNSNTPESCRVFRERVQRYLDILRGDHYGVVPLRVHVYGDAAGNQRKTSADRTDWKIVKDFFSQESSTFEASFFGGISNPTVKGRVNAMNAMLCNASGERRMFADPVCKELTADLEQVAWRVDSAGNSLSELDKSNPKRTHVSDALGYLVEKEFGLRAVSGPRQQYLGA